MRFSIIIPVYNVEKYLKKCVQSILTQSYKDYEVILVDDGSTDSSGRICDEYAGEYGQIAVIHQDNGGLSSARNKGLENASGEYIVFIDSDDWIGEEVLSGFSDIIDKHPVDLIIGKAKTAYENGQTKDKKTYLIPEGEYSTEEYMDLLLKTNSYSACAPFTIYRSSFIYQNGIRFIDGLIHEDEVWTPNVLLKAKNVYVSDIYFYFHYCRDGSINRSKDTDRSGRNLLQVVKELQTILKTVPEKSARVLREQMVILYLQAVCLVNEMPENYLPPRYIRNNSFTKRTILKSLLYSLSPKLYVRVHKVYIGDK